MFHNSLKFQTIRMKKMYTMIFLPTGGFLLTAKQECFLLAWYIAGTRRLLPCVQGISVDKIETHRGRQRKRGSINREKMSVKSAQIGF